MATLSNTFPELLIEQSNTVVGDEPLELLARILAAPDALLFVKRQFARR